MKTVIDSDNNSNEGSNTGSNTGSNNSSKLINLRRVAETSKELTEINNKGFFQFDFYVLNTEHILYLPVYCLSVVVIQLHALAESNLSKNC